MAEQTEYEELLEEFVKDARVRELLGTGEGMMRDARVERRERGLANALLAFSGSKRRVEKPVTEAKRRELSDKEDVVLGDVKQQMLDLAKLQQKILEGELEPDEARKQRLTLLGKLMDTARGVMATTATSISARNRDQLQLGLKQYDEAKGAYESLTLLGQDAKGTTPTTPLSAAQARGEAGLVNFNSNKTAAFLMRVPKEEREGALTDIREALVDEYTANGKKAPTELANLLINDIKYAMSRRATGSLVTSERAMDRLDARQNEAIFTNGDVKLSARLQDKSIETLVPQNQAQYQAFYKKHRNARSITQEFTDAAKATLAENFADPVAMVSETEKIEGSVKNFLQSLSQNMSAVGGSTFQRDLNRLLRELSGMEEGASVSVMLDAILGDEAAAPELAERIQSVEDRREELLGKVPTRDEPVTPTSVKEELARKGERFMQERGTSLSALSDPTQFLRQAYKARRQTALGKDVNMPFRSGKRFAGMEADLKAKAAQVAAEKREEDADEEVRRREQAAERSPI